MAQANWAYNIFWRYIELNFIFIYCILETKYFCICFGYSSVIIILRMASLHNIFNFKHVAINLVYEQFNIDYQWLLVQVVH